MTPPPRNPRVKRKRKFTSNFHTFTSWSLRLWSSINLSFLWSNQPDWRFLNIISCWTIWQHCNIQNIQNYLQDVIKTISKRIYKKRIFSKHRQNIVLNFNSTMGSLMVLLISLFYVSIAYSVTLNIFCASAQNAEWTPAVPAKKVRWN